MESNEVYGIIMNELEDSTDVNNLHGIKKEDIKNYLVLPFKKKFFNPITNVIEEHWVVFDEKRESNTQGYVIFYSEADNAFGLGGKANMKNLNDTGTFIGVYGSFINTIESM